MGTILLNRHLSPFDILVKNFFQSEEQFQTPNNKIINHPVDIYDDGNIIYWEWDSVMDSVEMDCGD